MSLRTNVCPVNLRELAQVRFWKRAERKTNKGGDVKESILVRKISVGKWELEREEEDEEKEKAVICSITHIPGDQDLPGAITDLMQDL